MMFKINKELSNETQIPRLGLGSWKVEDGDEVSSSVKRALEAGYRLIDTTSVYKNELGVGEGLRQSGIPREEIYITTKLLNSDQGYESTLKSFDESLRKLDLDYVDLYLISWPVGGNFEESWKAMEEIYESGRAKSIGVSNFHEPHSNDSVKQTKVVPSCSC